MTLRGLITLYIVMGGLLALLIWGVWRRSHVTGPKIETLKKDFETRRNEYLESNGITVSNTYSYANDTYRNDCSPGFMDKIYFEIDQKNKKAAITSFKGLSEIIPFEDFIGCEDVIDSEVVGSIGRAVAGGIIAGGAGAVVGAVTAKKSIMSYSIVIYTKDLDRPRIDLNLLSSKTNKTDKNYKIADEFAKNINAVIKSIINQ